MGALWHSNPELQMSTFNYTLFYLSVITPNNTITLLMTVKLEPNKKKVTTFFYTINEVVIFSRFYSKFVPSNFLQIIRFLDII